jgi:FKBP-type peptidyl-prolyl cis-trans isomerase SlyD
MKVEKNKVISLSYVLTVDGEVIETVTAAKPMNFIMGTGYLLPMFESHIDGKAIGDTFEFTLTALEAYGEVIEEAIVELPKHVFQVDGKIEDDLLVEGNVLPMADSEGNRMQGVIEEVKEESIIMNFNHPLAGETLHFKGIVEAIREASPEELINGLYGEKTGACGCGCDSGDCESCG